MGGTAHPMECTGHIPYLMLAWCVPEGMDFSLQITTHLLQLIILTYQTLPADGNNYGGRVRGEEGGRESWGEQRRRVREEERRGRLRGENG